MINRTLSHYKVLDEISRGGMGIVYKALDLKLNREVALKVLPPESRLPKSVSEEDLGNRDADFSVAEHTRKNGEVGAPNLEC